MSSNVTTKSLLMTFAATLALTACGNGADRVVSPGEGSFPPAPVPAPPMIFLFGGAAAALVARKRFAKRTTVTA